MEEDNEVSGTEIQQQLKGAGLKVTPQRIAVLEAIAKLNNHPTADNIITYIREKHPGIATGTVYQVLDTLAEKGLLKRVKTAKDVMRYDAILESHHHLYCDESGKIEDYFDNNLDRILKEYFDRKGIPGFEIEEIKLQIKGQFTRSTLK